MTMASTRTTRKVPMAPCGVFRRRFMNSVILDPLIEPGIEDVSDKIDDRIGGGHDQHAGLDGGQVARLDGDDQLAADPGNGEYFLDNNDAAEKITDIERDDGDGRQKCVTQR